MKRKLHAWEGYALSKFKPKRLYRYISLLAVLTIMCLYARAQRPDDSGPASSGSSLSANTEVKEKDLERFPMVKHKPDLSRVNGLVVGDEIPDYLWDLPLWVVNHPDGRDTITLREYEDKGLLVLDFWAPWCTPCVESVEKWRKLKKIFAEEIAVVTVHMDYDYKALPFAVKREWEFPIVIGESTIIMNRHFFTYNRVGGVAIIKDKKLVSIPYLNKYDEGAIDILLDDKGDLESNPQGTYFENKIVSKNAIKP